MADTPGAHTAVICLSPRLSLSPCPPGLCVMGSPPKSPGAPDPLDRRFSVSVPEWKHSSAPSKGTPPMGKSSDVRWQTSEARMRRGGVPSSAAAYQEGYPLFSGKLKLGWRVSYPKSCGYTHSRRNECLEFPPLPVPPHTCEVPPAIPTPSVQAERVQGTPGWHGIALGSSTAVCSLCCMLTTHCFSSRETEQFFPKNAAFGGYPGPGPQSVHAAAQLRAHLLQQHQQPLSDVLGACGCVHREWTWW